jgi:hypothetical protein
VESLRVVSVSFDIDPLLLWGSPNGLEQSSAEAGASTPILPRANGPGTPLYHLTRRANFGKFLCDGKTRTRAGQKGLSRPRPMVMIRVLRILES